MGRAYAVLGRTFFIAFCEVPMGWEGTLSGEFSAQTDGFEVPVIAKLSIMVLRQANRFLSLIFG